MAKYVYVCAFSDQQPNEPISFQHAIVDAASEADAYDKGAETTAFAIPKHCRGRLNDYVVKV